MKKSLIILALIVIAIIAYFYLAPKAQEREDLGTLTETTYNADAPKRYCRYKLTSAKPDGGYININDIFCIECDDNWPGNLGDQKICPVRIKFISKSGLVKYEAELVAPLIRACSECTDGTKHFIND